MSKATSTAVFRHFNLLNKFLMPCRCSSTLPHKIVERHRKSKLSHDKETDGDKEDRPLHAPRDRPLHAPRDYKFVLPEFLPDPVWHRRDRIREKLEHMDMYRRRANITIPEFYVGSIMAVTVSDSYAPGKRNRFVGICIYRGGHGLRAQFTLRNVVDGQGLEINYEMYNPTLQKIEVLKLEKRLDEELYYLRDAPAEFSSVPFDFEPVQHPPGAPVPVNSIKVKLGPRPWLERWERQDLQGVEDLGLPERFYKRAEEVAKPWEKHDLMKQYRKTINEDETADIMNKVYKEMTDIEEQKKKHRTYTSDS